LGIISEVGFGLRDLNEPVLWWTVHTDEHWAALQVFHIDQAAQIIKDYGVRDVRDLDGKPVWVEKDAGLVKFARAWTRKAARP
jgi:hypothetical protein